MDTLPAGERPNPDEGDDELVFATPDLGRGRPVVAPEPDDELGFAAVPRPEQPSPKPRAQAAADGFVIREAPGATPTAPLDSLVVGVPEPAPADPVEEDEPPVPATPMPFRITRSTAAPAAEQLWTTRDAPDETAAVPTRRGWATRQAQVADRSVHATTLRLREEAVNVSWKSAWIAVSVADPKLARRGVALSDPG